MAILKGQEIVFAVRFEDEGALESTMRVLYQTSGGRSKSRDEVEISTKDIDGTDYGKKTETIAFEGLMSTDDPALTQLEKHIDDATFAEILEININTLSAKVGKYMVSNFDVDYPDDESATYSFDAKLVGNTTEETLAEIPEGATTIE